MNLRKTPGFTLLVVGALLMFVARPVVDSVPLIGGALQAMAFIVGGLGLIGGGYLMLRSLSGLGRGA